MLPDNFDAKHQERIADFRKQLEQCNKSIAKFTHEYEKIDMVNLAIKTVEVYLEPYQNLLANAIKMNNTIYNSVKQYRSDVVALDKNSKVVNDCDEALDTLENFKGLFSAYDGIFRNILEMLHMHVGIDEDSQLIHNYEHMDQEELLDALDTLAADLINFDEMHPLIAKKLGWI